ncbi:hypothetical protein BaRGS_00039260 [Batillaria attramentaria]|uniref:H15 domain-containing protein n=1 Tax=Batillaria attramentaria TaxID=370345 RepID=A0ABD0J3Z8_9CAEN|nr:hypothetical protein BaRGS_028867 [Batillaria attramentaria]
MAEIATAPVASEASKAAGIDPKPSTSKKSASGAKKVGRKTPTLPEHPKYSVMIADAISALKERGGSSRQAILKYIGSKYSLGSETVKINSRLKMALKAGVKSGNLKQSKGTGAAGSFRLGERRRAAEKRTTLQKKAKKPKATAKKPTKPKSPKKTAKAAKKPTKSSKSPAKKTGPKQAFKVKSPAKKTTPKKLKAVPKGKAKSPAKKSAAKPKKPKTAAKKTKK